MVSVTLLHRSDTSSIDGSAGHCSSRRSWSLHHSSTFGNASFRYISCRIEQKETGLRATSGLNSGYAFSNRALSNVKSRQGPGTSTSTARAAWSPWSQYNNTTLMHYAENECAMPFGLHCNELRALCLTTNALCRTAEIGALLLKCELIVYIWPEKGVVHTCLTKRTTVWHRSYNRQRVFNFGRGFSIVKFECPSSIIWPKSNCGA